MTVPRYLRTAGFRMTALAAALFLLSMSAVAAFFYLSVREDMEGQLRSQISIETRQLLGDYADDGLDELRHDISERLERNPGTRLRYTLKSPAGMALFDRLSLPDEPGWSRMKSGSGTDIILLTTELDQGYWLGVAADTETIGDMAAALRHGFLVVVMPMIALAIFAGAVLSHRFLARVERLKRTADLIGKGTLSARLDPSGSGDDFDGLIDTINRMLDRIEELVHDLRHVSANIAHDLRSPLGRVRQRLEAIVAGQGAADMQETANEAIVLLDDTLETFSAILQIAELEAGGARATDTEVDLASLLDEIAQIYEPVAAERADELVLRRQPASVYGNKALLTQMLANLVENAIRHNANGIQISLECGTEGGRGFVRVADNGSGIPDSELAAVLKPFRRLDTSRSTRGNGLGLSLASSIASYHRARLDLKNLPIGLEVTVWF
ncbi:MAG: HAMP domain-containing histidine kinase [Hyphomonas sp.]|nr:HAMP domain-containing histidine kinase [Hyphomonas sp.]